MYRSRCCSETSFSLFDVRAWFVAGMIFVVGCASETATPLEQAEAHFSYGRFQDAIEAADMAIADASISEKSTLLCLKGRCYWELSAQQSEPTDQRRLLDQAVDALSASIDAEDSAAARHLRCMVYKDMGEEELSMADREKWWELDADQRGLAYVNEGAEEVLNALRPQDQAVDDPNLVDPDQDADGETSATDEVVVEEERNDPLADDLEDSDLAAESDVEAATPETGNNADPAGPLTNGEDAVAHQPQPWDWQPRSRLRHDYLEQLHGRPSALPGDATTDSDDPNSGDSSDADDPEGESDPNSADEPPRPAAPSGLPIAPWVPTDLPEYVLPAPPVPTTGLGAAPRTAPVAPSPGLPAPTRVPTTGLVGPGSTTTYGPSQSLPRIPTTGLGATPPSLPPVTVAPRIPVTPGPSGLLVTPGYPGGATGGFADFPAAGPAYDPLRPSPLTNPELLVPQFNLPSPNVGGGVAPAPRSGITPPPGVVSPLGLGSPPPLPRAPALPPRYSGSTTR